MRRGAPALPAARWGDAAGPGRPRSGRGIAPGREPYSLMGGHIGQALP